MRVVEVRNVCEALSRGIRLLENFGQWEESRAGRVLVAPWPVATVYSCPMERVLTAVGRDANPFFHLMEAVWMLAGRQDARYLDTYVRDFGERFAERTGRLHGAYGFRWRTWFGDEAPMDQLARVIELLRADPQDRRIVLTMWDPAADLGTDFRDIPCNTHVYFRVRDRVLLDMTVCCRSNDIIWGAYGANAVHLAFLMEYVATMAGLVPGRYTQMSNNYHAYEPVLARVKQGSLDRDLYREQGLEWQALVTHPETFDTELEAMMGGNLGTCLNTFLSDTVVRAADAHALWKAGQGREAVGVAETISAPDWRIACTEWLRRHQR